MTENFLLATSCQYNSVPSLNDVVSQGPSLFPCSYFGLYAGRKLEEKKLKCKQAIDTAEKIKKENILIKNEVR